MEWETEVNSPAKINLHLDIKPRRPDGFHDIISVFHKIDLYDKIRISSLKNTDDCRVHGDFCCPPEDNLIIKAAKLFLESTGIKKAYSFDVQKWIPDGAGLGGGSGNAATVLKALNSINGMPMAEAELFRLGELLGSDVPFFIGGPAALAAGRGEVLKELPPMLGYEAVLAVPDIRISSGEAYSLFDREGRVREDFSEENVVKAYMKIAVSGSSCGEGCWPFFNSFTDPICLLHKEINNALGAFERTECVFSSMSGSGSAVFGLYIDPEAAEKAFKMLKKQFKKRVWKIKLLA